MTRLSLLLLVLLSPASAAPAPLVFNRDVRPILSDKCYFCHGPDEEERKGELRLDIREEALEALAPGDPEKSELVYRILTDDEDDLMPPPKSHKELSKEEKEVFRRWIAEGAEYQEHWAYVSPVRKPGSGIDPLVRAQLARQELKLSPPADPHTIARRLSLDIIGLPPSPEEVEQFVQEYARDPKAAVSATADRLLASPHYGERMAAPWLDAVRYADSVGYHGDQSRDASPYRDYVIKAFNTNLPFDRFTREQIAGDLLPEPTLDQRVAASYSRLGQLSEEGGIQDAEYIKKYQSERVRTTATAWLGSTLACAECHDHKFDPFSQRDFYSFAAFFADILEKGAWNGNGKYQEDPGAVLPEGVRMPPKGSEDWGPQVVVASPEDEARMTDVRSRIPELEAKLQADTPELAAAYEEWKAERLAQVGDGTAKDHALLDERPETDGIGFEGAAPSYLEDGSAQRGKAFRRQTSDGLTQHIVTRGGGFHTAIAEDKAYAWVRLDTVNPPAQIMVQFHSNKKWEHRAWWGPELDPPIIYGKASGGHTYQRIGDLPKVGEWVRLEIPLAKIGLKPGAPVEKLAFTQFGGTVDWDEFGVHTTGSKAFVGLPEAAAKELRALAKPTDDKRLSEKALREHHRSLAPLLLPVREEITALKKEIGEIEKRVRTTLATVSAKPREIRILPRGDWMDNTGEVVLPATPHFLPGQVASTDEERRSRLDLANWIASPENPLTARTFVNRLWAQLFGTGLSGLPFDLGLQGEFPSHPELLDWLALEFVESGWDVKNLVKTIVTSDTYLQSSATTSKTLESDPHNRLLARQSRVRLPAEGIRDVALTASGLLDRTLGGRSVRPYQPAGYYQHLNFPRRTYQAETGANLYRRGVYTHWQRTFLHPMMKAFGAPPREECSVERPTSNTPVQALTLLNDPTFVEAARTLALRVQGDPDPVDSLVRHCLGRSPTETEHAALLELGKIELARFEASPEDAKALLSTGASPPPETDAPAKLAAMTSMARAVLNLHETITRY